MVPGGITHSEITAWMDLNDYEDKEVRQDIAHYILQLDKEWLKEWHSANKPGDPLKDMNASGRS